MKFELPVGDETLISEVIEDYNQKYKTDFQVVDFDDKAGTTFAIVEFDEAALDDVFLLGYFFGGKVQGKRQRREIDW